MQSNSTSFKPFADNEEALPHEFPQLQLFADPTRAGRKDAPPHKLGSSPSPDRQYEIKNIWDRHRTMIRMAVMGLTHKEIAEATGVTPVTVSNILNSSIVKKELELRHAALDGASLDIAKEIQNLNPQALLVLKGILEDDDAPISLRAKVAMDNLSRAGFAPVVRGVFEHNYHFSAEEIEQIKADAIAGGARLGNIVEAEFSELAEGDSGFPREIVISCESGSKEE